MTITHIRSLVQWLIYVISLNDYADTLSVFSLIVDLEDKQVIQICFIYAKQHNRTNQM